MTRHSVASLLATLIVAAPPGPAVAVAADQPRYLTVASTTSTENSGLFRDILPQFTPQSGIEVRVVAPGTGQALDVGRSGDADVVFVHDEAAELAFVSERHGIDRREVMHNDFVVVGPAADPARVAGSRDVSAALATISAAKSPFVSRGDNSGTHTTELRSWRAAGIDTAPGKGTWYRETGSGMGATLNTAAAMDACTLSDRATWLAFADGNDLRVLVEGDPRLFNQYGVILVNPARHPHVTAADARSFKDWLVSGAGQSAIAGFRIGGEQASTRTRVRLEGSNRMSRRNQR